MFLVGLSQGPPHHFWYIYLDKWLPKKTLRTVVLKILADQFIAAPFFAITFLFGMGILEDKRLSECWREFVKKFPVVYMVSWSKYQTHKPLFLYNFVDYVRLHFVCIVSCALCKDVWIVM